jgi:hypothetical protein
VLARVESVVLLQKVLRRERLVTDETLPLLGRRGRGHCGRRRWRRRRPRSGMPDVLELSYDFLIYFWLALLPIAKKITVQLDCDSKETQANHVGSKLSDILKVYFENMFKEKYI